MTDLGAPDAGEDLDALVRRVDPDRWLSSRFIADAAARADVVALYAYDHQLARAVQAASNPLLAEIRLTWWREAVDEIYEDRPVRRHPTAQALREAVRRRGLPRGPLEAMIDARIRELDGGGETDLLAWSADTGGATAVLAAQALDPQTAVEAARPAGALWALGRRQGVAALADGLAAARRAARRLSVAAFPAVAHAVLVPLPPGASDLRRRIRLTIAVARGRI